MGEEKIVTMNVCADCEHEKVCRHREDYLAFVNAISEFSERCNGDKICDGVVAVDISCNYYAKCETENEVR